MCVYMLNFFMSSILSSFVRYFFFFHLLCWFNSHNFLWLFTFGFAKERISCRYTFCINSTRLSLKALYHQSAQTQRWEKSLFFQFFFIFLFSTVWVSYKVIENISQGDITKKLPATDVFDALTYNIYKKKTH